MFANNSCYAKQSQRSVIPASPKIFKQIISSLLRLVQKSGEERLSITVVATLLLSFVISVDMVLEEPRNFCT